VEWSSDALKMDLVVEGYPTPRGSSCVGEYGWAAIVEGNWSEVSCVVLWRRASVVESTSRSISLDGKQSLRGCGAFLQCALSFSKKRDKKDKEIKKKIKKKKEG
jgi:hypothetical protein